MPRGGRRPGAGAPKGNLNGLKHNRYSKQFKGLVETLAAIPEVRDSLKAFSSRKSQRERKAQEQARRLLIRYIKAKMPQELNQKLLGILGVETPEKREILKIQSKIEREDEVQSNPSERQDKPRSPCPIRPDSSGSSGPTPA